MSEAEDVAPVREGEVLAGKYRVERVLGVGGMGVVVAARHAQLGTRVALKFLLPQAAKDADTVTRFLREAHAAARITSEHVARIIDVGTLDGGAPYLVMEYLQGRDLDAVLEERGALPVSEAVDYLLQAMEALAEAHAGGIVHRDLKPANLFLAERADGSPLVKVLDFGISKAVVEQGDAQLTQTQGTMGSPLYMSPEQIRSAKHVDARSDIWALGVVLYELLAGSPPFKGESMGGVLASIIGDAPRKLSDERPEVPLGLVTVIERCLAKDRDLRPRDVAELASALAPFASTASAPSVARIQRILARQSQTALPDTAVLPGPAAHAATVGAFTQTTGSGASAASPKLRLLLLGGSAVALLGALAVGISLAAKPEPPASVTASAAAEPVSTPAPPEASEAPATDAVESAPATVPDAAPPPAATSVSAAEPKRPTAGKSSAPKTAPAASTTQKPKGIHDLIGERK